MDAGAAAETPPGTQTSPVAAEHVTVIQSLTEPAVVSADPNRHLVRFEGTIVRRGGASDVPYMRAILAHTYWHLNGLGDDVPSARYVEAWGRPGDTVVVALRGGHRVGAGWFRTFRESAPGHGFVDCQTPR